MSRKRNFAHSRSDTPFLQSLIENKVAWLDYAEELMELSLSLFKWENLPPTIDERFLELTLFENGSAVFFEDADLGLLCLPVAANGDFNVYRIPKKRRAYSVNGYHKELNEKDSVIIFNNLLHTNSQLVVRRYAERLWDLDRTIDINAHAQKTPMLLQCKKQQLLTMQNLYKNYAGNMPVIYADKNLDLGDIKVLNTNAPYVADRLYTLRTQIYNEALSKIGVPHIDTVKKERMISQEALGSSGDTIGYKESKLAARKQACEQINLMFGDKLEAPVSVDYRDEFKRALSDINIIESEVEEVE